MTNKCLLKVVCEGGVDWCEQCDWEDVLSFIVWYD